MKQPLAVQLYSVRKQAEENFPALLKTIASIGYCGVEFAGAFYSPNLNDLSNLIQDLGLKAVASHVALPTKDNIAQTLDEARILGYDTLITSVPNNLKTADDLDKYIEKLDTATEVATANGLRFCVHNHWWEFAIIDGKSVYETLLTRIPNLLNELDTYWATKAGAEPSLLLKEWQNRIPLLHVKDGLLNDQTTHLAVGDGKMDFKRILTPSLCNNVEWFIVELDNCETDVIEAIRQSYRYLIDNDLGIGTK